MGKRKKPAPSRLYFEGIWFENGQVFARIPASKGSPASDVLLLSETDSREEAEDLLEEIAAAFQEWIAWATEQDEGEGE